MTGHPVISELGHSPLFLAFFMRTFTSGRIIEDAALLAAAERLESLAVVRAPLRYDDTSQTQAVIANLWCGSTHEQKDKQPKVQLNRKPLTDPTAVPTFLVATEKLIKIIEKKHAGCHAAAETARANAIGTHTTLSNAQRFGQQCCSPAP